MRAVIPGGKEGDFEVALPEARVQRWLTLSELVGQGGNPVGLDPVSGETFWVQNKTIHKQVGHTARTRARMHRCRPLPRPALLDSRLSAETDLPMLALRGRASAGKTAEGYGSC